MKNLEEKVKVTMSFNVNNLIPQLHIKCDFSLSMIISYTRGNMQNVLGTEQVLLAFRKMNFWRSTVSHVFFSGILFHRWL